MKDKWNFGGRFANSDWMHYLRFAAVPLIAVLLIAVILSMDKGGEDGGKTAQGTQTAMAGNGTDGIEEQTPDGESGGPGSDLNADNAPADGEGAADAGETEDAEGSANSGEPADTEGPANSGEPAEETGGPAGQRYADIDISGYTLKKDEVPELLALVRTYCQAKEDCDPELLARLFGKSGLTGEEIAAEKERMELVKASVKRYENISCYTIEGPEPDSYVAFPYFELQYRGAETRMPQLAWVYVTKTEDGSFIMNEEVSEDVAAYIARIGEKEEVAGLRAQVADAQAAAVASDEKLRSIYSGESEVVIGS